MLQHTSPRLCSSTHRWCVSLVPPAASVFGWSLMLNRGMLRSCKKVKGRVHGRVHAHM